MHLHWMLLIVLAALAVWTEIDQLRKRKLQPVTPRILSAPYMPFL
jgi:hypothetical protein